MKIFLFLLSGLFLSLSYARNSKLDFEAKVSESDTTVYAIGDIHGDFQILKKMVEATGVINESMNWVKPNSHLVLTGDYLNRGNETKQVLNYLIDLQKIGNENLHILSGNHERLRLMGSTQSVPVEDKDFKHSLFLTQPYSDFIKNLPIIKKVGPFVFMHGGIDLDTIQIKKIGFTEFNKRSSSNVEQFINFFTENKNYLNENEQTYIQDKITFVSDRNSKLDKNLEFYLWGNNSPLWSRTMASVSSSLDPWIFGLGPCFETCEGLKEVKITASEVLTQFLDAVDAKRLVLGHTIQENRKNMISHTVLKDKLSLIDVANSVFYGKGRPGAFIELDIKTNTAKAFEVDRVSGKKSELLIQ